MDNMRKQPAYADRTEASKEAIKRKATEWTTKQRETGARRPISLNMKRELFERFTKEKDQAGIKTYAAFITQLLDDRAALMKIKGGKK